MGLPTVDTLPDPRFRMAGNPHLSGHHGGHDVNLREMGAGGMTLLGRIEGVDGERLRLTPDLLVNLERADRFFDDRFRPLVETFIARTGLDAPPDDRRPVSYEPPEIPELDLGAEGISTIIWATGYRQDYGWIDLPIIDELGFPLQRRGVTDVPGLYFLGSLWQHTQARRRCSGRWSTAAISSRRWASRFPTRRFRPHPEARCGGAGRSRAGTARSGRRSGRTRRHGRAGGTAPRPAEPGRSSRRRTRPAWRRRGRSGP